MAVLTDNHLNLFEFKQKSEPLWGIEARNAAIANR